MAAASGVGARRARATGSTPRTKRRHKRAGTPKEKTSMATTKKKRKARKANPTTHAKSGSSPKRKKSRGRKANPSHKAAKANPAPKRKTRRKARKSNPTKRKSNPTKRKTRRKARKSNPATTMTGKEPKLRPTTRRKARGMKRTTVRTSYKSRNKHGKVKHYHVTRHFPNPIGNVKNVVVLGVGTLIGYEITDMADRYVATMSPSNAPHAWYASDAAHRIMARPNGARMLTQVGLAALFFGGSVLTAKRYPMIAYGFAGAFIGSVVHFGHQLLSQRVWPMIGATDKGNERTWGNRLYPAEQAKLLDLQDKAIEAQDKTVTEAKDNVAAMPKGMQDGPTKGNLPDDYLYPTSITYSAKLSGNRSLGRTNGTRELPEPPARVREADLRTADREASTLGKGYEGEPTARPRSSTLACGGCGGCDTCSPSVSMESDRIRTGSNRPLQRSTDASNRPLQRSTDASNPTPPSCTSPPDDRSNQPCKDMSGNASVTDASGDCIEMISIPGGGGASSGRGGLDLQPTNPPIPQEPQPRSGQPILKTSVGVDLMPPADSGRGAAAPSLRGNEDEEREESIESLASGGRGPHSTSSLIPT